MKVTEKKISDNLVQLDAVATASEVDQAFRSAHFMFAQQMNLRPEADKGIPQLAEEQLGIKDLDSVVLPQVKEELTPFAIDKRNIIPAYPAQTESKSPLKRGSEYSFSVLVAPKPDYELSSYDPVSITVVPFTPDVTLVDKQIEDLRERYATFATDEPHSVAVGDNCLLKIEAKSNGEDIPNLNTEGRTYTTGAGLMPDGFDENIVGMDVGETKTFTFEGPSIDEEGKEITETVECTATVLEIQKRILPEINDEWVSKNIPMLRDAAALRGSIEEQVTKGQKTEYENYLSQVAVSELATRFQGRIADEVYESVQQNMLNNIRQSLQQQGMTFEQFIEQNGGEQQFQMMLMMQVRQTLVQGYSLDALFRHEGMALADEDLDAAAAAMDPQNAKMLRQQMEQSGRGFALREMAERMKANAWLVEHADITYQEA